MNTLNRDLAVVIKDMPQSSVLLDVTTIDGRKYYKYSCEFIIDQIAAYNSNVREARVDVAYKLVGKAFTLLSGKKFSSTSDLNRQILRAKSIRSNALNQKNLEQKSNVFFVKKIDLFASTPKISKFRLKQTNFIDLVSIATSFEPAPQTAENTRQNLSYDLVNDIVSSSTSDAGTTIYSRLVLGGRDPAASIAASQNVQDSRQARTGLIKTLPQKKTIANSFVETQSSANLNSRLPTSLATIKQKTATADIPLPFSFQFPVSSAPPDGKIVVICTIRDADGRLVQQIDFNIDHENEVNQYEIPRKLPSVGMQAINKTHARLSVFNSDPRIDGVAVYERNVPRYQSTKAQSVYVANSSVSASWRQKASSARIRLKTSSNKIVRFLPILSNGTTLGNFTSKSFVNINGTISGTVVAVADKALVTVNLYEAPSSYSYVQFVRKNIDKHQKLWENIKQPIKITQGIAIITDENVRAGQTYEYGAILQDKYGNTSQARITSLVTVQDYTTGTEIIVTKKTSSTLGNQVTTNFNVAVKLSKDSDTSAILESTKKQGTEDYFAIETQKLAGDLNSITKVNIKRVTLATGNIVDLGVVEPGDFSDTTSESSVYIFEGLVRNQVDIFEETGARKTSARSYDPRDALQRGNIVSSALTTTQKISSVNYTQKFLSKKSLLRGTLSYGNTKDTNDNTSGFLQGKLGIVAISDVVSPSTSITINNFKLSVGDSGHRLLTFDVTNGLNQIDFFIISTIRGGIRSVVGTCHFIDTNVSQRFLDDKTQIRSGRIAYIVTPVGYDGTAGNEITSQQFEAV